MLDDDVYDVSDDDVGDHDDGTFACFFYVSAIWSYLFPLSEPERKYVNKMYFHMFCSQIYSKKKRTKFVFKKSSV